jgi:shikimate kinase
MSNYILIGMPGSGKTTKGRIIAENLGMDFIDTDEYIFRKTGYTPARIVKEQGRDEFIRIQDELISGSDFYNAVISTGGGMIYSLKAMDSLKNSGTVIFLNVPQEKLSERVDPSRKLSGGNEKNFSVIYGERLPVYKKFADIEIICDDKEADEIISLILCEIKRRSENDW